MAANPSGRFVLRTPPALHRLLRRAARHAGVSLNQYCVRRLSQPPAERASGAAAGVAAWARDTFGGSLRGVVVYGSWARGEATSESDVDVLVVLEASAPLTRDSYRKCDGAPVSWDGHPVQVQIVRLPGSSRAIGGGLWPEIALDGIVTLERDFELSRILVAIRRAIADGRLVRRTAHGQPYWTTRRGREEPELGADVRRAAVRLRALDVLFDAGCWADVVRESQELVELALKGLLRAHGVAPPRVHDMSAVLEAERGKLPPDVQPHVERLAAISKDLRRDRELAFDGTEDLTPSSFYAKPDAERAREGAAFVVRTTEPAVL